MTLFIEPRSSCIEMIYYKLESLVALVLNIFVVTNVCLLIIFALVDLCNGTFLNFVLFCYIFFSILKPPLVFVKKIVYLSFLL